MTINRGKQFEQVIYKTFSGLDNISIDRFLDPTSGYLGIRNICDFGIYDYPNYIYLECKVVHGNSLNFKSRITDTQLNGIFQKTKIKGVIGGILVWFIDHDITVYVHMKDINSMGLTGFKSLNIKQIQNNEIPYIILQGKKSRVFFKYDGRSFLNDLKQAN